MVSGDGFWQTRGFQGRHGAAAILSCCAPPKVVDLEICCKTCNVCMGQFLFLYNISYFFFFKVLFLLKNLIQINIKVLLDRITVKKTLIKVLVQWNLMLFVRYSNDQCPNMVFITQNMSATEIPKHFLLFLRQIHIQV